jgi:hypothetical protein
LPSAVRIQWLIAQVNNSRQQNHRQQKRAGSEFALRVL